METNITTTKAAKPAKTAVSNLMLGNADDALALATELQKFVKANGLTSNIQGKAFPQVEAWMFAGSLLGLSSMLESIEDRSTADEIKWQAMVSVINTRTGAVIGRGFATCSNKEQTKRSFADYAICSMAQTRAVGKAYRLSLGWLMKAAGYEATPAEEMQDVGTSAAVVAEPPVKFTAAQLEEVAQCRDIINDCRSKVELREAWDQFPSWAQAVLKTESKASAARIDAAFHPSNTPAQ